RATRYDVIVQVMGAAQAAGLTRIGFVTDVPPAGSAAAPAAAGAKP
ncbi:biopolymer transporter ExbD, partial [Burkholderia cenocepacia]|nr:biopolymer transporter ExbD [Burkholderia cenocepacia]